MAPAATTKIPEAPVYAVGMAAAIKINQVKVSGARFQGRKIPRNKSITRVWVNNIPAQINNARFKKIPENSTKIPR